MGKVCNLRPIVLIACFFILGILSAVYFKIAESLLLLFLGLITFSMMFVFLDALLFKRFKFYKTKSFCVLLISVLVSYFISYAITDISLSKRFADDVGNGLYSVTACVDEVSEKYIVLDDVVLKNHSTETYELYGKVVVFVDDGNFQDVNVVEGNKVSFVGKYKYTYKLDNSEDLQYISSNKTGQMEVAFGMEVIESSQTLRSKVLMLFDNSYGESLSYSNALIAKALLFGDRSDFSERIETTFTNAGVMHLFAVSGLHVGFLCAILSAIFSKIIKNKKISAFLIFVLLLCYVWICGFTPSVNRALVMIGVVLFSQVVGRQYDGLNSLALACLIILLVSPFQLFSVGFILSFCAVLSIFCFEPIITGVLVKFLPKGFASYISVVLAAQVGTMPVVAYYFSTIQLASVLTNIVSAYIATFAFGLLFFVFILSAIFPALSIFYVVPNFVLTVLRDISIAMSNLDISITVGQFSILFVYVAYVGILFSSEYSFLSKKWMYLLGAYAIFACGLILL